MLFRSAFHVAALAIRESANVPVHPNVKDVAANKAVDGEPPNVRVTLVSSVLVNAAGVIVACLVANPSTKAFVEAYVVELDSV